MSMFLLAFVDGQSSPEPPPWLIELLRDNAWDVLLDADHDSACVLVHPLGAVGGRLQPDLVVVNAVGACHQTLSAAWAMLYDLESTHSLTGVPVIVCCGMVDSIIGLGSALDERERDDRAHAAIDLDALSESIELTPNRTPSARDTEARQPGDAR